jgi:hypothetical protein
MITEIVTGLLSAATELLGALPQVFDNVVGLIYFDGELSNLGMIIVATAGFALAWAGIRFIFSFVQKLLGRTRGGAR